MTRIAAVLITFLILASLGGHGSAAAEKCRDATEVYAFQTKLGSANWIGQEAAQQIANILWAGQEGGPPIVDKLIVTFTLNNTVSIIPVLHGQVCVGGFTTSQTNWKAAYYR